MPPGTPFGPGIAAIATYLHGCQMVSYSRLTEAFEGLFGLKISEGAIANMLARSARPFADEAEKIAGIVRCSPVISSDEIVPVSSCSVDWNKWALGGKAAAHHGAAAFVGDPNRNKPPADLVEPYHLSFWRRAARVFPI